MKKKIKKELIEWVILISIIGVIYFAGWHTEVIGRIQQVVLSTGIIQPNIVEVEKTASYNFRLENLKGDIIAFDSFRNKVVFLNFWATWCPPCIAEMPDIHQLYESKKNDISFVMISLDKDENRAREFIKNKEFDFPVYFLRSALPKNYNSHSIPTTYVLDKGGIIKVENHGMAKYNTEKFKNLLSELANMQ